MVAILICLGIQVFCDSILTIQMHIDIGQDIISIHFMFGTWSEKFWVLSMVNIDWDAPYKII